TLTSYGACNAAQITIHNNIMDLVEADEKYSGFKYLQLYCNNELIETNCKITLDLDYPYTINFVLPANVVIDIAAQERGWLRILKPFLYLVLCNIKTTHTPQFMDDQDLYATEILLEKSDYWQAHRPDFTLRPGGIRTLAITVHDQKVSSC